MARMKFGTIYLRKHRNKLLKRNYAFYVIDAYEVAQKTGMGGRVNTIMQTCFFAISGVLPREEAIEKIKYSIEKTYGKRGEAVVQRNFEAVDHTLMNLFEVKVPAKVSSDFIRRDSVSNGAPDFVKNVLGPMLAFEGDDLPVSAFRKMALSRREQANMKNEIFPLKSLFGMLKFVFNAENVLLFAHMQSFV